MDETIQNEKINLKIEQNGSNIKVAVRSPECCFYMAFFDISYPFVTITSKASLNTQV